MVKKTVAVLFLMGLIAYTVSQSFFESDESNEVVQTDYIQSKEGLKEGIQAPNFNLQNLAGDAVSLEDYRGKKVVLNFWATWCSPCREEMPDLQKYYENHPSGEYEIVAINLDPRNNVRGFVDELKLTFPIVLDTEKDVQEAYEVLNLPYTYFIDETGKIADRHLGLITYEELEKILASF